jgi:hypothetical protein
MQFKLRAVVPVASLVVIGPMLGLGLSSSAGASVKAHARPHGIVSHRTSSAGAMTPTPGAPTVFHQEFSGNVSPFCVEQPPNAPCDGNAGAGDYGTVDRVHSGYSNGGYGNYAPATKSLPGSSYFAVTSGATAGNQGVGCPGDISSPGSEACTGPYALFPTNGAADGNSDVFPRAGFTVTDDLYLSPSTPPGPNGSMIDDDVELNSSTIGSAGYYGIDNIVTACYNSTAGSGGTPGFLINFSNNTGNCTDTGSTPVISTDGWYRYVFNFSNVGGDAYLTEKVYAEPSAANNNTLTLVATSGAQPVGGTATPITHWGGAGYFWLPDEDVSGLPVSNLAVQAGQAGKGQTP